MQPDKHTLPDDEPLAPTDAHEVLIDVTGGNQPALDGDTPDAAASEDDPTKGNGESLPRDAEEVSESSETAERLQSHAGEPSPPADAPGRLSDPE